MGSVVLNYVLICNRNFQMILHLLDFAREKKIGTRSYCENQVSEISREVFVAADASRSDTTVR